MALRVGDALANGHALPMDEATGSVVAANGVAAGPGSGSWMSWAFPPAAQLPGPATQYMPQLANGAGPSAPAAALYYGNGAQQPTAMPYANGGARLPGLAWGPGVHAAPAGGGAAENGASLGGEPVRRSSREPKSRIIMINGIPCLKANNYTLEEGEQSVFSRELKKEEARAPVYGAYNNLQAYHGSDWVTQEAKPKVERLPTTRAPNAAEQARMDHNARIRADTSAAEPRRAAFLAQHLPVLAPFITPQAAAQIRHKAAQHRPEREPKREGVEVQPECIGGIMREYQVEGLRWIVSRLGDAGVNAILADEMGLGKTLQTISFLAYMQSERGVGGPSLVVVPLSVISSWMAEFRRWAPHLRIARVHGSDIAEKLRVRNEVLANPNAFDVAVTTYDMMHSADLGKALCRTIHWRYLILDEGHKIKNEHTLVAQSMRHTKCQNALLLTGTPLQNNLHELYALLSFLYPDVFTDPTPFDQAFDLTKHRVDPAALEAAHRMLQPFCLRRLKADVEKSLPPRVETRINCPLSAMQTFWYRRLLLKDTALLRSIETDASKEGAVKFDTGNNTWQKLQSLIMQLRKCCNHPYLFPGAEPDFDGVHTGEDVVEASGKMEVLDRMLGMLAERGHRVVLFSQFNMMLDLLEDYLRMRDYRYVRLDGSTNRVQRMIDINRFNKPGSDVFIYILNTKAGGLGVNLQTADTCIIFDSDWNPQWDLQAMARVHRIGQTKPVHVYRFCTAGSVEVRVQQRAEKKLYLDQMVNRGANQGTDALEKLNAGELYAMLRFGADRIFSCEEGQPPSDAELAAIIDRSVTLGQKAEVGAGVALKADALGADVLVVTDTPADSPAAAVTAAAAAEKAENGSAASEGGAPSGSAQNGGAAAAAQLQGAPGGSGRLTHDKQNAAGFNAEQKPLSTCILNGVDYSEARSLRDIGREFWSAKKAKKRDGGSRLITIDGFSVLRENNYSLEEGEPSIYEREAKKAAPPEKKRKMQRAGIDYEHADTCQVCWDGGELVLCDSCPASYHPECIGLTMRDVTSATGRWACPHHSCGECGRGTGAAGGLLFRCQACSNAYCEDHLPPDADMIFECPRFLHFGQHHPKQACFIHCSPECKAFTESQPDTFDAGRLAEAAAAKRGAAERVAAEEERAKAGAAAEAREDDGDANGAAPLPGAKRGLAAGGTTKTGRRTARSKRGAAVPRSSVREGLRNLRKRPRP